MTHAKFSPSASSRWTQCHGSLALSATVPEVDRLYAREGSFAHAIAEQCLLNKTYASDYLGTVSECGDFKLESSSEMVKHVNSYVDYVRSIHEVYGGTLEVEQRVHLTDDIYGTADALLLAADGKTLHVVDFKYGQGVIVDPTGNLQMLCYAGGALHHLSVEDYGQVEEVQMHIFQPRAPDSSPAKRVTVSPEFVSATAAQLQKHVDAIKSGDRTLATGKHCRFCNAAPVCPARGNETQALAKTTFSQVEPAPPSALTATDLAQVLEAAPRIKEWLLAVEEHARLSLEQGKPVPGHKLVAKRTQRRWRDEKALVEHCLKLGIDPTAPSKIASPAQLEKLLKTQKADVKHLAPFIERRVPGFTVAPETDPRPGVRPVNPFTTLPKDSDD